MQATPQQLDALEARLSPEDRALVADLRDELDAALVCIGQHQINAGRYQDVQHALVDRLAIFRRTRCLART